ncbi:MAG: beta-mannosidase [Ruminococcus sp.]|nr:beta-mannosidase [Ruminococcus sp.]
MHRSIKRLTAAISAAAMAAMQLGVPASSLTYEEVFAAGTVFPYTVEGEDLEGADLWTKIYANEVPGYSGEGFWYLTASPASLTVTVPEDAMYQLTVRGVQILSKENETRKQTVEVNGQKYSIEAPYSREWRDYDFGMIRLKKGENTIKFINEYGYMGVDTVTVSEAVFPDLSKATDELIDPDATENTKALMKYLKSVYGTNILSGQQQIYGGGNTVETTIRYDANADKCVDSDGNEYTIDPESYDKDDQGNKFPWHCTGPDGQVYTYSTQNRNYTYNNYDLDVNLVHELTGKYPAIQGFDFGSYCPCYAWDDGVAGRMIEWTNEKGGICTASWHVNVPTVMADYTLGEPLDFSKTTYKGNEGGHSVSDFKTANCMVEGTVEYEYFQLCMKNLAAELKKLQDAGVPVIFRPFHEAEGNPSNTDDPTDGSGAWFWWSKEGADVYKQLWNLLQDTLINEYGLHNLIWEQNLYAWSDYSAAWYSGDDRVDIVAFDKYNTQYNRHDGKSFGEPNLDAEGGIFYKILGYVKGNKMVAMAENDSVPSLENMQVEHANWLYFCPWYDSQQAYYVSGESYQDREEFKKLYNSDYCITLDELPADLFSKTSQPASKDDSSTGEAEIVWGDANCDGEVNMADAVFIMQSIGNPDKYGKGTAEGITEQGEKNGDVNQTGNGLTNKDALAIQKYKLGLLATLPEK